ncbi:dihydropteroate synthase [Saccharopolyspora mangrovi]|uniref:Dihydropteroate synthase n=1 Tax=Saccharopolyspora mangrovi TaxID=3082379 RepID=A0ABU6ADV5_9PSEU|nr:dihydropteroate synthase [Saccharopolyspora sp. S2-29]MEB3369743.1 dihydropteroate synthase [Saccharopolyspora sp. S2-29]
MTGPLPAAVAPRAPAAAVGTLLGLLRGPRKLVCGILNVTPDSFSDGGAYWHSGAAVRRGLRLVEEGADILDIGGESTRPGSCPPSVAEELDRVVGVVEQLAAQTDVPLSIDTSRPEVMREAVAAGATLINDVRALRHPGAVEVAAELGVPVCLSHMLRPPSLMQHDPSYDDVLVEVAAFLRERIDVCLSAGIPREHIVIDPGFGFGKTLEHNLTLLRSLSSFTELGAPVMAGLSRKTMLGQITGRPVGDREAASVAAAVLAAQRGAKVLRVHDVAATVDVLRVLDAVEG